MRRERERERFDRGASKTNAEQLADSFFIVIGMNDAVANTNLPYFSSMSFLPLSLSLFAVNVFDMLNGPQVVVDIG